VISTKHDVDIVATVEVRLVDAKGSFFTGLHQAQGTPEFRWEIHKFAFAVDSLRVAWGHTRLFHRHVLHIDRVCSGRSLLSAQHAFCSGLFCLTCMTFGKATTKRAWATIFFFAEATNK
jgi:hypothetical protein